MGRWFVLALFVLSAAASHSSGFEPPKAAADGDVRGHNWGDSLEAVAQAEKGIVLERGVSKVERVTHLTGTGEVMGREAKVEYTFFDDKLVYVRVMWLAGCDQERVMRAMTTKYGAPDIYVPDNTPAFADWQKLPRHNVNAAFSPARSGMGFQSKVKPTWAECEAHIKSANLRGDASDL